MEPSRNPVGDSANGTAPSHHSEGQLKPSLLWQFWRICGTVLFLVGVFSTTLGLASLFAGREIGPGIITLIVGILLIVGSTLLVIKPASKKTYDAYRPTPGYLRGLWKWLLFIAIGGFAPLAWELGLLKEPEWKGYAEIGGLLALLAGVAVLLKTKPFRWHEYLVVGLAIGAVCYAMVFPSLSRAHTMAEAKIRRETFQSLMNECDSLVTFEDLENALRSPIDTGGIDMTEGSTLVLEATRQGSTNNCGLDVSPLEGFLPRTLLAENPEAVQVVAIVGAPGAEDAGPSFGGLRLPGHLRPLVAPILVYSWPEKRLVLSAKLETGCTGEDSVREVYSGAAEAIRKLLVARTANADARE